MIGGLVLAAGASRRLGRPKQLLELAGRPLLEWPLAVLRACDLEQCVVVLGHEAARIQASVDFHGADVVINPRHAEGMSTSLHAGLAAMGPAITAAVVLTCDQPLVTADHLRALIAEWAQTALPLVATDYGDHRGVPMILARDAWAWADAVTGDQGARALLQLHPDAVTLVHTPDAAMDLDVDTAEQYALVVKLVGPGNAG